MSAPVSVGNGPLDPRKPLDNQANMGSDMSIMTFVQADCPSRFAFQDEHRIKGLNAEALVRIFLPAPSWIMTEGYAHLRSDPDDPSSCIFFSLNLPIYNQQIVASEWAEQWFFVNGRVHPYALTWEVETRDGLETDTSAMAQFTIPALVVRDSSYQPILPRTLAAVDRFPTLPPVVAFTGPVIGSGRAMLRKDVIPALDDVQLKCCGFIQLSTFITPGNPDKTPFKGFHPFQIFVIFPVHANPWAPLCKKMVERQDTHFQANNQLTCTGKVVGLLDRTIMTHPPGIDRDYVFIIVPDTWTFLDRATPKSTLAVPLRSTSAKEPSCGPMAFEDAKAMFASPPKPTAVQPPNAPTPPTPVSAEPHTPRAKRAISDDNQTPTKKRRTPASSSGTNAVSPTGGALRSCPSSTFSQDTPDESASDTAPTSPVNAPAPVSITTPTSNLPRPHRSRHPPKKYPAAD